MRRRRLRGELIDEYLRYKFGESSEDYLFMRQALYSRRMVIFVRRVDWAGDMRIRIERYLVIPALMGHRVVVTANAEPRSAEPFLHQLAKSRFCIIQLRPLPEPSLRWCAKVRLGPLASSFLQVIEGQENFPNALVTFSGEPDSAFGQDKPDEGG